VLQKVPYWTGTRRALSQFCEFCSTCVAETMQCSYYSYWKGAYVWPQMEANLCAVSLRLHHFALLCIGRFCRPVAHVNAKGLQLQPLALRPELSSPMLGLPSVSNGSNLAGMRVHPFAGSFLCADFRRRIDSADRCNWMLWLGS